jgi:hypothetical protein
VKFWNAFLNLFKPVPVVAVRVADEDEALKAAKILNLLTTHDALHYVTEQDNETGEWLVLRTAKRGN